MVSRGVNGRLRFTVTDDLTLLHTVINFNPYEDSRRWENVRETVTRESAKNFSLRAIREHVEHLIKLYVKQDRGNLKKSGTEEQYQVKEKLLQQIMDLKKDFDTPKSKKVTRMHTVSNGIVEDSTASCSYDGYTVQENVYYDDGYEDNVDDLIKVEESDEVEYTDREANFDNKRVRLEAHNLLFGASTHSTGLGEPDLHSLKEKIRLRELALEERKLAIEERKIRLEESKFELEKSEKEKRLAIELEERKHRLELDKQQSEINKLLIEYLISKK